MRWPLSPASCSFSYENFIAVFKRLSTTRPEDFTTPPRDGSRLSLQGEVVRETELRSATAGNSVPRRERIPDRNRSGHFESRSVRKTIKNSSRVETSLVAQQILVRDVKK